MIFFRFHHATSINNINTYLSTPTSSCNNFKESFKKSHVYGIVRNNQIPSSSLHSFQLIFEKRLNSFICFFPHKHKVTFTFITYKNKTVNTAKKTNHFIFQLMSSIKCSNTSSLNDVYCVYIFTFLSPTHSRSSFQTYGTATDIWGKSYRFAADQQRTNGRRWVIRVSGEQPVRQGSTVSTTVRPRAPESAQRPTSNIGNQHYGQRTMGPQWRPDVQIHRTAQEIGRYAYTRS